MFLSEGGYGRVFLATDEENNKVAIKEFFIVEDGYKEAKIMKTLHHQRIYQMIEWCQVGDRFYIVYEFIEGNDLWKELSARGYFSESDAKVVFIQLLYTLSYLKSMGVIHRDLKLNNIMLTNTEELQIKLIDFGLAARCKKNKAISENIGTPGYMAIEIIQGKRYTDRADLYSLGVILYELISGESPFWVGGAQPKEIKKNQLDGKISFNKQYWKTISPDVKNLISQLICKKKKRLRIEEIWTHPWLKTDDIWNSN